MNNIISKLFAVLKGIKGSGNSHTKKNDVVPEKTPAEILLEKLKAKGPTLDRVGQVKVQVGFKQQKEADNLPTDLSDEIDEPISGSRQLQQLKASIYKEFSEKNKLYDNDQ